ncbi:vomeronasal type-2 receptor 1-like [Lynx pardinus]|uniref:Vomeronasal type-2 receptor 1-like n=1 Tax=Lynx pardinus TaxID=191816 RepID=A0A485NKG3_LYNPA|nr:vomeronasal type-2 receptor 1-like [Lynx pardinus]
MESRKKCLVLGFLAFLWAELGIEGKEEKGRTHLSFAGGLFPIHYRAILSNESVLEPVSAKCEGLTKLFLFLWGFRWMKTMIHTIKEINKRKDILPNITLGYQIFDTCFTISKSVEEALGFLTGREENKPNFRNSTGAFLAGIVGVCGSSLSSAVSRILGLYYLPQSEFGKEDRLHAMSDEFCIGEEKLEDLKNTYLDVSQLRITNNVKQAVYSLTYALDGLSRCEEGHGPYMPGNTCVYIPDFEPWQLMYYLKGLKFTTHNGERIEIDENGDVTMTF